MTDPRHDGLARPHRAALLGAVALVLCLGSTALGQDASAPVLPGEPNPPRDDGALPATADPSLVNVRPRTWEHVLVAPDGRTITVYRGDSILDLPSG